MLARLRPHAKRVFHFLLAILRYRVRLGASVFLPVHTLLVTLILIVLTIVGSILHHKETVRQAGLRSHQRYPSLVDDVFSAGCRIPGAEIKRANASFVMLARNEEHVDVVKSMRSLERHFNQWYGYPWVFLNDVEFTQEFKDEVQKHTHAECHFGTIDAGDWQFPEAVRGTSRFEEGIATQGDRGIMYGSMESYHKMCRFYSGFFYKHELVRQFEWYWRVEPDVEFFCDITYDPFVQMAKSGKKYGFTIMIKELSETIPNLFRHTKAFLKKQNIQPKSSWSLFVKNYRAQWKLAAKHRYNTWYKNIVNIGDMKGRVREVALAETLVKSMKFLDTPVLSDDKIKEEQLDALVTLATQRSRLPTLQGESMEDEDYNLYHFWSNFEIARVDLWDNPVYEAYFQYLEQVGGFFSERWGDAPMHSLAVGFMLDLKEIHYFRDIGYQHTTIRHCPANAPSQLPYEPHQDHTPIDDPKFEKFWLKHDPVKEYGVGCRCRCPTAEPTDIEDTGNDFLKDWFAMMKKGYKPKKPVNIVTEERLMKNELKKEGLI